MITYPGVAQLVEALGLEPRGWRFDSSHPDQLKKGDSMTDKQIRNEIKELELSEVELDKEIERLDLSFMGFELYKVMRRDGEINFEHARKKWPK